MWLHAWNQRCPTISNQCRTLEPFVGYVVMPFADEQAYLGRFTPEHFPITQNHVTEEKLPSLFLHDDNNTGVRRSCDWDADLVQFLYGRLLKARFLHRVSKVTLANEEQPILLDISIS